MSVRAFLPLAMLALLQVFFNPAQSKTTMEQLQKTGEMMRTVCLGKSKASLDQVEALSRGEEQLPEGKEIMCYANCVLEMMQAMRKGKVIVDSAIKQIDMMLPEDIAEPTVKAFNMCRNSADGIKNNCEAAYAFLKCNRDNNPKFFFA
uniref:Odorant-binding protein 9 n=1 Tax=Culex quinquefasciatus TaxID=7176 RepID=C7BE02_CULQU|nr:odorant-binding protein 9 [Culex quinquefasciatus]